MWQKTSGIEHSPHTMWPHWKAISFLRSMQIAHVCASSSLCILSSKSSNLTWIDVFPPPLIELSFSSIFSLQVMHFLRRMLHSAQQTLWRHGRNMTEHGSSSHNLHFEPSMPDSSLFLEKLKLIYLIWNSKIAAKKLTSNHYNSISESSWSSCLVHNRYNSNGCCFCSTGRLRFQLGTTPRKVWHLFCTALVLFQQS